MTFDRLLPVGFCGLGLVMVFREVLFAGGAVQLNDAADPRFNEFLLEHSWRWLRGDTVGSLFDLPVAYPVTNTLAYSEPMISFAPLYWPFRAGGLSTAASYTYWLVAVSVANFACFYAFMRKALGQERLASSIAAFLFAFGLPRVAQIGHSQLWPQPYLVLVLWGMYALFFETPTKRRQRFGVVAVVAGLVLQAWGSLYNAIFVGYVCLATGFFALLHPAWRERVLSSLKETGLFALACVAFAGFFLWPLAQAYLTVYASTPDWDPQMLTKLQPRLGSLVYVWPSSWFYSWMTTATPLGSLPARNEQALGVGLLTTVVVVYTLARGWRTRAVHLLVFLFLVLWLPTVMWPGDRSFWFAFREWIPGLHGLRSVSRIGLLLLFPASIALGFFVQRRSQSRWPAACVVIALLCLVEQGTGIHRFPRQPYQDVVDAIVRNVDPNAEAFFYVGAGLVPPWYGHIDAMLAAQRARVPTVNMFSGKYPSGQSDLHRNVATDAASRAQMEDKLAEWMRANRLDPAGVQVIYQIDLLRDRPRD